ncbi:MAG: glycosyltransferase family 4 protein [Desulfobacterales bacterium]|nr:glycosyltransferase family 4 protein [Desulfobacterales bacterium]
MSRFLSNHFRLALLSDEADLYPVDRLKELTRFQWVHLIKGRPETSTRPPARMARMQSHAHSLMRRELSRMIANLKPAIVQIEYTELAGLVRSRDEGGKWFITLHDVLTGMGERWRAISELYEKRLLKRYDGVICCSGDDYDLLPIQNKILIDNGVSLGSFDYAPSTSTPVILFMGPFRYAPNREGILWFVRRVFPDLKKQIPALALRVLAAKNPMEVREKWPGLDRDGVEILDFTEDIRGELANASVTINPMKNIRGSSIKVIESLASGRICVTTADGARGYSAAGFKALRIADSGEEFIKELGRLLTDHDLRRGLESPDLNALESYDWKNLAQKQRGFYSAARFPGRR